MRRRSALLAVALAAAATPSLLPGGRTEAAFTGRSAAHDNRVVTAPDWEAPSVVEAIVAGDAGTATTQLRVGEGYRLYVRSRDGGNPASGTSTVVADLAGLTNGAGAAALELGSFTVGTGAFGWRSPLLTVDAATTGATLTPQLTLTDQLGNRRTVAGPAIDVAA